MKKIIAFIPNLLTLCNLLSGCAAVSALFFKQDMQAAFWFVIAAAVFDFCDGAAARLLHVSSPIGKELDSLADMVSFGFAPSAVVFTLLWLTGTVWGWGMWLPYVGFLIAACSALRLAKFNIDERQHEEFRGLPTPACALFFVSLPMLMMRYVDVAWLGEHPAVWVGLSVVFSALLVCDIPMFSLKFKSLGWRGNELRYVFLIFSVLLIAVLRLGAPAVIIAAYILVSVIRAMIRRKRAKACKSEL